MKKLIVLSLLLICYCNAFSQSWKLIYENDAQGNQVNGKIEELISAIKDGQEIRVAWGNKYVYHIADAAFITIMTDSVVTAQIEPIYGQSPEFEGYSIQFKENLEWRLIAGSNGKSDAMTRNVITGEIVGHNARNRAFRWYAKE